MLDLIKNALIAATKYLQKNLPLELTLLKGLTCLSHTVRNRLDNSCNWWTYRKIFSCYKRARCLYYQGPKNFLSTRRDTK